MKRPLTDRLWRVICGQTAEEKMNVKGKFRRTESGPKNARIDKRILNPIR